MKDSDMRKSMGDVINKELRQMNLRQSIGSFMGASHSKLRLSTVYVQTETN